MVWWVQWTWLINKYTWPGLAFYAELNCKTWWWSGSYLCWLCILIEEESCIMEIWWLNQTGEFGQNCVMNNFLVVWGSDMIIIFHLSSPHTVLQLKQNHELSGLEISSHNHFYIAYICPEIANKFWSDIISDRKNNLIRCGWHTGNQQDSNQLKIELNWRMQNVVLIFTMKAS